MKILIVEDERLAVQKLTKLLTLISQSPTVVGITDGIESTVEWLKANPKPDLILMDIELCDGQSFEIFNLTTIECPVIFTTSYDESAIKSFRGNSLDYLLKPIKKEELEQALHKFQRIGSKPLRPAAIDLLVDDLRKQSQQQDFRHQLLVSHNRQLVSVEAADIAYFYAQEGITQVYSKDKTNYIIDYTLEVLENLLEPTCFFRVNDQFIIEASTVSTLHQSLDGKLSVDLKPYLEQKILVSRDRVKDFQEWIGR